MKLSIVIPAYNEAVRLPPTLRRLFAYLSDKEFEYEVIVVDDGSTDQTVEVIKKEFGVHPQFVVQGDGINRGRSEAVRRGMLSAKGEYVLETDSDGSVSDEAIGACMHELDKDLSLQAVFGSREMKGATIALAQPMLRVFLGYGFIYLTRTLFWMWNATDFTLGFKMYRSDAAYRVARATVEQGFVGEAELYIVSHIVGIKYKEIPVVWTDNKDSRVRPFRDTYRSLKGLAAMFVRWCLGKYR